MQKAIVLIDGENFLHKIDQILEKEGVDLKLIDKYSVKLDELISTVFKPFSDIEIEKTNFYCAKLSVHPKTEQKSHQLIAQQRKLKITLEKKGINFIIGGKVRGFEEVDINGGTKVIFKEKGVDVRIAVDMIAMACDGDIDTIILCSSDSDLQPAVKESITRGIKIVYLGFSIDPNKGLMMTTTQTVLFRNPEIINALSV